MRNKHNYHRPNNNAFFPKVTFTSKVMILNSDGTHSDLKSEDWENSIFLYEIDRLEVESCNIDRLKHDLRADQNNPYLKYGLGNVIFSVSEYEFDDRELDSIPEFQSYMAEIQRVFPCWFYYAHIESHWLQLAASSIIKKPQDEITRADAASFLWPQLSTMEHLCDVAKTPEEECDARIRAVFKQLGLSQ